MFERADRRFSVSLVAVACVFVAGVLLWSRGDEHQLAVERRLPALRDLAARFDVPLEALAAGCIADAYRSHVRSDERVAEALSRSWKRSAGDPEAALRGVYSDGVEAAMTIDVMRRNRARWQRLLDRRTGE